MKTAMQELIDELESVKVYKYKNLVIRLVKNKLEKEREQIIEAFEDGQLNVNEDGCLLDENGAEQYYNQTYNQNT
jgi:hypothetical protein